MKNNFLLVLSLYFYLASCSNNKKDVIIPDHVIKKETMKSIIVDLSLLESARSLNLLHKTDSAQHLSISPDIPQYQEIIFKKYGVTKEKYDSSFSFYSRNPKLLVEIFEEAGNEISQMQAKLGN